MNYLKWFLYAVVFMFFFYPLVEMASSSVEIFGRGFFSFTGFIAVFLFALTELLFAAYAYDFGRKKDSLNNQKA